jgi:serine phosphatase RsbU (regulator of sigma subunit)
VIASANVSEGVEFLHVEPNAPIGLWPGLEFVGETIDSIKGQPLLVYTDGLNEAEDCQQQQFGDDRLLQVLTAQSFESARQTIALLSTEIEKHRAGAEPNDDLTMLCLKLR